MNVDVYEQLARVLDLLPEGFTRTQSGVEIKILKKIFSPEEALVASNMSGIGETADIIAARAKLPKGDTEKILNSMLSKQFIWGAEKHIIWGGETDGVLMYRLAPFAVGFYEEMWETMDHEFVHLVQQYREERTREGVMLHYQPALMRVVPAQRAIPKDLILPYDDVKSILLQAKWFEARDCICRKHEDMLGTRTCNFPLRVCLIFSMRKRPKGKYDVTQEEALNILDQCEEIGLVHDVANVVQGVYYVCNCCGCCCGILKSIKEYGFPNPSGTKANYYSVVDLEECDGCGICEERCQMQACSVENGIAVINLEKCIGCGLCVTGCPTGAVKLNRRPDAEIITPPDNYEAWEQERLRNRGLLK